MRRQLTPVPQMASADYIQDVLNHLYYLDIGNLTHIRIKLTSGDGSLSGYLLARALYGRITINLVDSVQSLLLDAGAEQAMRFRLDSAVRARALSAACVNGRSYTSPVFDQIASQLSEEALYEQG